MLTYFLGQYLVDEGIVGADALDVALAHQHGTNTPIGTLAIERGYLGPGEVAVLMAAQEVENMPFGLLAVRRGLLTEEQAAELREIQAERHVFLGEALMATGGLSAETLATALAAFERRQRAVAKHTGELLRVSPEREVLMLSIEALEAALRRFVGLPAKLLAVAEPGRSQVVLEDAALYLRVRLSFSRGLRSIFVALPEHLVDTLTARFTGTGRGGARLKLMRFLEIVGAYIETSINARAGEAAALCPERVERRELAILDSQAEVFEGLELAEPLLMTMGTPEGSFALGYFATRTETTELFPDPASERQS